MEKRHMYRNDGIRAAAFWTMLAVGLLVAGGCATKRVEYTPFAQTFEPRQEATVTHDDAKTLESKGYHEIGSISAFYPASEGEEKKVQGQLEEMLLKEVAQQGGDVVLIEADYQAGDQYLKTISHCAEYETLVPRSEIRPDNPLTGPPIGIGSTPMPGTGHHIETITPTKCVTKVNERVYTHGLKASGSVWRQGRAEEYLGEFITLLGKDIRSSNVQTWLKRVGVQPQRLNAEGIGTCEGGGSFCYYFPSKGICLVFTSKYSFEDEVNMRGIKISEPTVYAVYLYAEGGTGSERHQYKGALPYGLSFLQTPAEVHASLGRPTWHGKYGPDFYYDIYPAKNIAIGYHVSTQSDNRNEHTYKIYKITIAMHDFFKKYSDD